MASDAAAGGWFEGDPALALSYRNLLGVEKLAPADITNAMLWLCSDEARYITGVTLPIDAGFMNV
jgi:NAD(P)-dependent dehydrogenase (short-subunit alcohol dehydrogenase family)